MPTNSQKNKTITEPEIGNGGVISSKATAPGEAPASSAELAYALELSQQTIARLEAENKRLQSGSNSIEALADILAKAIKPQPQVVPNEENINRTADFKNTRNTVDGRSLMEAQQTLQMFRGEKKIPVSISKTMANAVGSSLSVTVNGVRVCVPCDGKTYYINETHAEHIKERLAKIDILTANTTPDVVEIN
jgi:hypothetical protein